MSAVKEKKIQEHYDTIADIYDLNYDQRRGRCYHSHLSTHIMDVLPKGGKLLDISCGTGLFVKRYIENGGSAIGIDVSRKMIERAQHRCINCDYMVGTGEKIPFCDNSFDAVSSLLVFRKRPGWQKLSVVSFAFPLIPGVFIMVGVWMTLFGLTLQPKISIAAIVTIAAGALLYHFRIKSHAPNS